VAKLKTAEDKARLSLAAAIAGLVLTIGPLGLLVRNFSASDFMTVYNGGGPFLMVFGGLLLGALAANGVAFLLAWTAAGARRNEQMGKTWLGFFLGATGLAVCLSVGVFFYFTRHAI
jgi:hypothetical protein